MYIYKIIIPRATIKNYTKKYSKKKNNSVLKWNTKTCSNNLKEKNRGRTKKRKDTK